MTSQKLFSLLDELVKCSDLQPKVLPNGEHETYCNFALMRMASYFGCNDFAHGPNANTMYGIMATSQDWQKVSASEAFSWANQGHLAVAAKRYAGHGHVAVVCPSEKMHKSGSWGVEVPYLGNVGKTNGILPCSQCFPVKEGIPDFFVWIGSKSY